MKQPPHARAVAGWTQEQSLPSFQSLVTEGCSHRQKQLPNTWQYRGEGHGAREVQRGALTQSGVRPAGGEPERVYRRRDAKMRLETSTGIHSPFPHQVLEQKLHLFEYCSDAEQVLDASASLVK